MVAAQEGVVKAPAKGFIETFDDPSFRDGWWFADFDFGGETMVTGWRRHMALVETPVVKGDGPADPRGGALVLRLAPAPEPEEKAYFGAEIQRDAAFHYGAYEVVMQAGRGPGVVSSFFTYTGPHFKTRHDEIDVEILGKNTSRLHLNAFADGKPYPNRAVDLGFDAAEGFHTYRFEWRPESVTWLVDGVEVFRMTAKDAPIPSVPGKLYASIWGVAAKQEAWAGVLAPGTESAARYDCMSFRPFGDDGPECSDYRAGADADDEGAGQ